MEESEQSLQLAPEAARETGLVRPPCSKRALQVSDLAMSTSHHQPPLLQPCSRRLLLSKGKTWDGKQHRVSADQAQQQPCISAGNRLK